MWVYLLVVPGVILFGSVVLPSFWGGAWSPTPMSIVNQMLEMADLQEGETLFDLGAGDGRVLFTAAAGNRVNAVGVEIDPVKCFLLNARIKLKGLGNRVQVVQGDFFTVSLAEANVVFLYLSPVAHNRLSEKLARELKAGARVVSYRRTMPDLPLEAVNHSQNLYLYRIGDDMIKPLANAG